MLNNETTSAIQYLDTTQLRCGDVILNHGVTADVIATPDRHQAFATRLRALANIIENNPDLSLPRVAVTTRSGEEVDRWSVALLAAGHDVTDWTTDHARTLSSNAVGVEVCKVHDESMRHYYAQQRFLREHAAEIDALNAEPASA